MQVISLSFVGHLGHQLPLSAASMATSFANVTGFSLLGLWIGILSAKILQDVLYLMLTLKTDWEAEFILSVISVMFVGHLGELPLSGASMATAFASVTGLSVLMGMGSALDTLCGQAFGAKQFRMLGIHMQRAMLILSLVSIPIAFIWAHAEKILIGLHQDREISEAAGVYAQWMIPSIFGYALLQCYVRFLQTQNIVLPMLLCSVVVALVHVLSCWLLVYKTSLGFRGPALASSISIWFNVSLLAIYVKFSTSCKTTWTGFSKEAFCDIPKFIKLMIPSTAMICLEFWVYESLVLLSGLLPNPKLETSVMTTTLNTSAIVYMIITGLGSAVSTRVSNELGAGNPQAASRAVHVGLATTIGEGLLVGLILVLIRNIWGCAYSNNTEVVKAVADTMPFLALTHLLDGTPCVSQGIARGCGWQKMGAYINLGSHYIVGVPISVVLAFVVHLGVKGLWIGILCAKILQDVLYLMLTLKTDWEAEVKKANDRVFESIIPDSTVT